MRILLVDPTSSFLDFALRCEADGHEVRVFMGPTARGERSTVGDGLLKKYPDWRPHVKWAQLILCSDNCKYMKELQTLKTAGYPVFHADLEGVAWEMDRLKGQQVLAAAGIECMPCVEFTSFQAAIDYQLSHKHTRFVCKPCADVDKALSYVSHDAEDMVFMLERWKRTMKLQHAIVLQEFQPGIEMAVGGWVGRNGFAKYFLENFEFKKLMPGNSGPNTGEMGTVMKYMTASESKLSQQMLLPLEADLIRNGYEGYIDVAVIVDDKGQAWPLEFTSRMGWPAFQIQQILHPDPVEWMLALHEGYDNFQPELDVAVGVVVAIPDFPYGNKLNSEVSGFPIWGVTPENRYYIHPAEVKLGAGGLVTAGDYVLIASGCASRVSAAQADAYNTVKELRIPNSPMYRNDIGCRLEAELPKLQKLGFATNWKW